MPVSMSGSPTKVGHFSEFQAARMKAAKALRSQRDAEFNQRQEEYQFKEEAWKKMDKVRGRHWEPPQRHPTDPRCAMAPPPLCLCTHAPPHVSDRS